MNPKAKKFLLQRNAGLENATRYADGVERLAYDVEFVNRYIPDQDGKVLDLCCGTGMMSVAMAKKAKLVVAVDFNPDFLKQIPQNNHIVIEQADAADFCRSDQKFDLITVFGSIQYNTGEDVRKIYSNCYQMCRTGGHLIVSGQWGVKERVTVNRWSEELQADYFAEYRTLDEETSLLQQIGFRTELAKILPDRFNRFDDTKFMGIVATR